MRVSDFHFELPEELIAQHPPAERGASRMLVLDRRTGGLADEVFQSLPRLLEPGDLLVLNDSRVLPARLFATRGGLATQGNSPSPSGVIEVLLTEEISAEPGENLWRVLVKPARKVRVGETLHFYEAESAPRTNGPGRPEAKASGYQPLTFEPDYRGLKPAASPKNARVSLESGKPAASPEGDEGAVPVLTAEVVGAGEFGERTLRFAAVEDFYERVERIGHMPLPPYIRRDQAGQPDSAEDRERYQTVYSHQPGSAAAPTAGLHFTPEILAALRARGVEVEYITLHVGLGTFQPVRVERLEDIRLHAERYTLPAATADALNRALREGRRVIAVGTTTTRTLEHIARLAATGGVPGAKAHVDATAGVPGLKSRPILIQSQPIQSQPIQSEPTLIQSEPTLIQSRPILIQSEPTLIQSRPILIQSRSTLNPAISAAPEEIEAHSGSTSIFLSPGHRFRIVRGLLTNFHLPESTLLMLVSAFAAPEGEPERGVQTMLAAYDHAIRAGYRFYSYGDCMLVV